MMKNFIYPSLLLFFCISAIGQKSFRADIIIYGGNSSAIIAAVQAKKWGNR
jgi:thioredoxin reductase